MGTVRIESSGVIGREDYQIERLVYWTAPERHVPALLFRPLLGIHIHRLTHGVALPDVLRNYDLPDLAGAVAPRRAAILGSRDPLGRVMPAAGARNLYGTRAAVAFRREADAFDRFGW